MRARRIGHHDALRRVANRLVSILHGCLRTRTTYDEAPSGPPHNKINKELLDN